MTYTVYSCFGADPTLDPEHIAEVMAEYEADISASRAFVYDTPLARRASDHLPLCADLEIV